MLRTKRQCFQNQQIECALRKFQSLRCHLYPLCFDRKHSPPLVEAQGETARTLPAFTNDSDCVQCQKFTEDHAEDVRESIRLAEVIGITSRLSSGSPVSEPGAATRIPNWEGGSYQPGKRSVCPSIPTASQQETSRLSLGFQVSRVSSRS